MEKVPLWSWLGPALVSTGFSDSVAYLLDQKHLKPENILLLTFTNKAAGEMQERVLRLRSTVTLRGPSINFVPAFCAAMVPQGRGFPKTTLFDEVMTSWPC